MPRVDLAEVDRRWAKLRAANTAYFDGRMLHVFRVLRNGHGGATLHVAECAYRHWAVGLDGFDTGVRALGVKAIVLAEGHALMGQRSARVAAYPGCWEFAPGGGVEPLRDPREMIGIELREEVGLRLGPDDRVTARAVLFDESVRSWEVVYVIRCQARPPLLAPSEEYRSLRWVELAELQGHRIARGVARGFAREVAAGVELDRLTDCARSMLALLPGDGDGHWASPSGSSSNSRAGSDRDAASTAS